MHTDQRHHPQATNFSPDPTQHHLLTITFFTDFSMTLPTQISHNNHHHKLTMAPHHHETMALRPNNKENSLDETDFPHRTQVQNTFGTTGTTRYQTQFTTIMGRTNTPAQLMDKVCYNHIYNHDHAVPHQPNVVTHHPTTTMNTHHEKPHTTQNDSTHDATIYNNVAMHGMARHLHT